MPSYQIDFPTVLTAGIVDAKKIVSMITTWESTDRYKKLVSDRKYYEQENETINAVKRYYWQNEKKKIINGKEITTGGGLVENQYVANYKIGYGIYKDIVSQPVNTLLDELPTIDTTYKLDANFLKNFGYALKIAGIKAKSQGISFVYEDYNGNFTVFESENCIPFFDDFTTELKALIRYWKIKNILGTDETQIIEVYEPDGLTVYENNISKQTQSVKAPKTPYKYIKSASKLETRIQPIDVEFPVIALGNNREYISDLTASLRAKIDAIDIVRSGFANNIDDFAELFWVIKDFSGQDSEAFEDFVANINRTKKVVIHGDGASADTHQIEIPTVARTTFINDCKREIVEETGVLDTVTLTGSSLTTTAIKAATMKLQQRTSDFEWYVYNFATELLELYQEYHSVKFDFDIDFTKLLIQNDTEIIDNMQKIQPYISKRSYLQGIKKAGYIQDVDKEEKQIDIESIDKYRLNDEVVNDSTQTDGQVTTNT